MTTRPPLTRFGATLTMVVWRQSVVADLAIIRVLRRNPDCDPRRYNQAVDDFRETWFRYRQSVAAMNSQRGKR